MIRLAAAVVVALGLADVDWLKAQDQHAPALVLAPAGTRVRVWLAGGIMDDGRLTEPLVADAPIVTYCLPRVGGCARHDAAGIARQRLSEVVRIERRTGDRSGRGALIGAALSLGVVLLGEATESRDSPLVHGPPRVVSVVGVVGLGAALGAVVGSASGHWDRIR